MASDAPFAWTCEPPRARLRAGAHGGGAAAATDVPPGYIVVPRYVIDRAGELPCDIYVRRGRRLVLYAATGTEAAALSPRAAAGLEFYARSADHDLLRRALTTALRSVLSDQTLPPAERSRQAYIVSTTVVAPLFSPGARVTRAGLELSHAAIDALVPALVEEDDLVWSMVASMQKHLATHTHALNTSVYALALAKYTGTEDADELRDIGRGALLHDLGKTRIATEILDKPGPLDPDEWHVMRTHPGAGYAMVVEALATVPSYVHIIAEHHERADGSGYPHGRRGHQVALDSQIVAIADAFDALTSERAYKSAASPFEALRTMRFLMRGQFHDELLRGFIQLLGGWRRLRLGELRSLAAADGV